MAEAIVRSYVVYGEAGRADAVLALTVQKVAKPLRAQQ